MNVLEYDRFSSLDNMFTLLIRGIEDHLQNDEPDLHLIVDSLCFFHNSLHDTIDSCKPEKERTPRDFAAALCDNCDKAWNSKDQTELDSFCKVCPVTTHFERR